MRLAAYPRVKLLDGFALELDAMNPASTVDDLPHGVQRLVAYLSLFRRPARTAVAGHLWPEVAEEHAHGSLRSALWRLQKAAPGVVEVSGGALRLAPGIRVDVRELGDWAERALDRSAHHADDLEVPDVWLQCELLPGWYDDWVLLERERLRQLHMHTFEVVAVKLAVAGRHGEALQAAYAAVRAEPLRESAHRVVVRVHIAEGNVVEAVRAYDAFRVMLEEELDVTPTEQMTRLIHSISGPHWVAS